MDAGFQINTTDQIMQQRGLGRNGKAQQLVDSETMRYMSPYMPFQTGTLVHSTTLGTVIGSGEVNVIALYASIQNDTAPTRSYDHMRGGQFLERMKIDHRDDILREAKKISGGK